MDSTLKEVEELVCRIKVFVHGPCKSGKSTLIKHLTDADDRQDLISDGVMVTLWRPLPLKGVRKDTGKEVSQDEEWYRINECFEFWELSGRKVFQGVHDVYLTAGAIHMVVVDITLLDVTYILEKWNQIQSKVPGSKVILVITKADVKDESSITSATKIIRQRLLDNNDALQSFLKKKINYLESIGAPDCDIQKVMDVQRCRSNETYEIICFKGTSRTGIYNIEARLRSLVTEILQQRKMIVQNGKMLKDAIDALKKHKEDFIVMAKRDFVDTILPGELDGTIENSLSILESLGQILDLRYLNATSAIEKEYICVNPAIFAKLMCALHMDNYHMTFKIDAQRFWPLDSGFKRPNSSTLERVLESLMSFGLIREALFPILWQDIIVPEDQMIDLIKVAERLALLIRHEPSSSDCEGLALPAFLSLSVRRQFHVVLMDKIKDSKPQLNWTSKPLQGDIQIGWRYMFPQGTSTGLLQRLLGCCKNTSLITEDYEYIWRSGLLKKVDQGMTCVEVEENTFTISIRVNAEEFDSQEKAVQTAWTVLIPYVSNTFSFLKSWAGLCLEVFVVFSGNQFHNEITDVVATLPLPEILISSRRHKTVTFLSNGALIEINTDMLFPFQGSMEEADTVSVIEHWITLVLSHRQEFLTSCESVQQMCRLPEPNHGHVRTQAKIQAKRTTKIKGQTKEIKWIVNSHDIMSARLKMDKAKHQDSNKVQANQKHQLQHISKRARSDQEELKLQSSGGHQRTDWGPEDRFIIEFTETASLFAAAVLASAVATFVEEESRINPQWSNDVTAEQVKVAQLAAESAEDPNSGSAFCAVQSVIDAIHAVKIRSQLQEREKYIKKQGSRTCLLL